MTADSQLLTARPRPFLEHYSENDGPAQLVVCEQFPFRIGRSDKLEYVIYSGQVSKLHAVIDCDESGYTIRDLGSTNGTFVNGQRIASVALNDGDIVHIAHKEFRFGVIPVVRPIPVELERDTTPVTKGQHLSVIHGRAALQEVLLKQHVRILFQSIVDLTTEATLGYEALGRGTHEQLSQNPIQLFELAEKCGLAKQLSRLFRLIAFREVQRISGPFVFFFNVHPAEMEDENFTKSLEQAAMMVRAHQRLVMEVHEDCVSDVAGMRRLRERLNALGIGLAYDDFGVGQSRLIELAEAPPDYLKLDMSLIRGIDQAPARQDVVGALADVASRLGVHVIAEGVETIEEAACCLRLGCHGAQGFLFGRALPSASVPLTSTPFASAPNGGIPLLEGAADPVAPSFQLRVQ